MCAVGWVPPRQTSFINDCPVVTLYVHKSCTLVSFQCMKTFGSHVLIIPFSDEKLASFSFACSYLKKNQEHFTTFRDSSSSEVDSLWLTAHGVSRLETSGSVNFFRLPRIKSLPFMNSLICFPTRWWVRKHIMAIAIHIDNVFMVKILVVYVLVKYIIVQ